MSVEPQGARRRTETTNRPGDLPLVVVVRDDAGNPVNDVSVTFGSQPLGSVMFPGDHASVTARTNARGEASTDYTPRLRGQHEVVAATTNHGRTAFTLDTYDPEQPVEVRNMDDGTQLVVVRSQQPAQIIPPEPNRGQTILSLALALVGLCFIVAMFVLMMHYKNQEPIFVDKVVPVIHEKVVPPVDNQARTAIAANEKRDDAQDARLIEEHEINWAIGGNAQRALGNDDALRRDFERFYYGTGSRGASRSGDDVCSGPHWALYEKCRTR